MSKFQDFANQVAQNIISKLDQGIIAWSHFAKPNVVNFGMPTNGNTKRRYNGINVWILGMEQEAKGYSTNVWFTFNQLKALGGFVRKGEKGTAIWQYKGRSFNVTKEDDGTETKTFGNRPIFSVAYVFNLDQAEGLDDLKAKVKASTNMVDGEEFNTSAEAESFINKVLGDTIVKHSNQVRAYYTPALDAIHMPNKKVFRSEVAYYSTFLHEIGHWTGHESRLKRIDPIQFADRETYGKEELVAELFSAMTASTLGMNIDVDNHVAYCQSWSKALKNDKDGMIVWAMNEAMKAFNYAYQIESSYTNEDDTE